MDTTSANSLIKSSSLVATNSSSFSSDLTPSARYMLREARKKLAQITESDSSQTPTETELMSLVKSLEASEGEVLSQYERTAVIASLQQWFTSLDVLTPLVENPEVNDIIVTAYNDVSVQTRRANVQTDISFADRGAYRSFIENLLKKAGKFCTTATPVVDVAISPSLRACVTHESFSPEGAGPMLTLRVSRFPEITLDTLVSTGLAPAPLFAYLCNIVESGSATILVCGEVGTGKTTLVRALASRIPEDQAILIIEDTHEIVLHRKFVRTLLTREANTEGAGKISPAQAIRTGMRMAMNRIVLCEMRDAEAAEAFIDVCSSGHPGISTIHARSSKDALLRLELFLTRAQGNIGNEAIRRQIANALSVIVHVGIDPTHHKRRILEVVEIGVSGDSIVQMSPIFKFNSAGENIGWVRETGISKLVGVGNYQTGAASGMSRPGEFFPV